MMDIDFSSSASQAYQKMFEYMLERERKKNDGLDLDEAKTNQIRGRISLLKELVALPKIREIEDAQLRIEHPE